jgi:hypothetical protein
MSHWNIRLVDLTEDADEPWIELCEVYYDDRGKPTSCCRACTGSETRRGIFWLLRQYLRATLRPIVTDFRPKNFDQRRDKNEAESE